MNKKEIEKYITSLKRILMGVFTMMGYFMM